MNALVPVPAPTEPQTAKPNPDGYSPKRVKGKFAPGVSGNPGGSPGRARQALNAATIGEMHRAFNLGGRKAIMAVMNKKPDVFLKLLVLLVPRELEVTTKGGVKAMTDAQLEAGIEAIQAMLAARADGSSAQVIEGVVTSPDKRDLPNVKARKLGRDDAMTTSDDEAQAGGQTEDVSNTSMISTEPGG